MMAWDRAFVFIPFGEVAAANSVAESLDFDDGGKQTFGSLGFGPDGSQITHYGCNTVISPNNAAMLPALKAQHPSWLYYLGSDGWTWEAALSDAGLQWVEIQA